MCILFGLFLSLSLRVSFFITSCLSSSSHGDPTTHFLWYSNLHSQAICQHRHLQPYYLYSYNDYLCLYSYYTKVEFKLTPSLITTSYVYCCTLFTFHATIFSNCLPLPPSLPTHVSFPNSTFEVGSSSINFCVTSLPIDQLVFGI